MKGDAIVAIDIMPTIATEAKVSLISGSIIVRLKWNDKSNKQISIFTATSCSNLFDFFVVEPD